MLHIIKIDLLILKTYDGQFTLTTKKSLHIIFKAADPQTSCDLGCQSAIGCPQPTSHFIIISQPQKLITVLTSHRR